jgi:predicted nucleic acid-binding Zn ribbon protein
MPFCPKCGTEIKKGMKFCPNCGTKVKKEKNPWIAALLNFLFWGLGYLYNGKRIWFGTILLLTAIIDAAVALAQGFRAWDLPSSLLLSVAFAYDAYKEASEIGG